MSSWLDFGFVGNERWGHTHEGVAKWQEQTVRVREGQSLFGSGLLLVFSSLPVIGDNVTASFQM